MEIFVIDELGDSCLLSKGSTGGAIKLLCRVTEGCRCPERGARGSRQLSKVVALPQVVSSELRRHKISSRMEERGSSPVADVPLSRAEQISKERFRRYREPGKTWKDPSRGKRRGCFMRQHVTMLNGREVFAGFSPFRMTVDVVSCSDVAATFPKEAVEQSSISFTSQATENGATAVLETQNCTATVTENVDRLTVLRLVKDVTDGAGCSRSQQFHSRSRADACVFAIRDVEHKAVFVFAVAVDHHNCPRGGGRVVIEQPGGERRVACACSICKHVAFTQFVDIVENPF